MANIDQYLDEIEVASRGEEVRDSIIDAFEALNSEGPGTMAWNNITGTPDTLTGYGVSEVPASMVSGVLALNNIPPSALERMVPVADDTARFALTLSDVQNGDTVKVLSTQKLYLVVDDTSLSTEAGYEEYRAGTADSVDWSGVLNTPDTLAGYGIEDAYTKTQTDTSLAAKSDKSTTYTKTEVDEIFDEKGLVDEEFGSDQVPYLFRKSGGDLAEIGETEYDKIVGGTVAWNQLAMGLDSTYWTNENGTTASFVDGVATFTSTINNNGIVLKSEYTLSTFVNHKYLLCMNVKCSTAYKGLSIGTAGSGQPMIRYTNSIGGDTAWHTIEGIRECTSSNNLNKLYIFRTNGTVENLSVRNVMFIDLTAMFGTEIADYIYSLEQANEGDGVAFFRKLFPKSYYPYDAGSIQSVSGLMSHDTVGFNQWDEEWEVGGYNEQTGAKTANANYIRTKNLIHCFGGKKYYVFSKNSQQVVFYFYDSNLNYISFAVTTNAEVMAPSNARWISVRILVDIVPYKVGDICINISDASKNGTYEPYQKRSYPLDSSLTLRGIPKLDENNKLYYDGDTYKADGTVTRRYGIVVIDENTSLTAGSYYGMPFRTNEGVLTNKKRLVNASDNPNGISDRLVGMKQSNTLGTPFTFSFVNNSDIMYFKLSDSITTVEDAKTYLASNPITVIYELATPTTESAQPFQSPQKVDALGTEEYVTTGIVPVGHETRYVTERADKMKYLPEKAPVDGDYFVHQEYGDMSLVSTDALLAPILGNFATAETSPTSASHAVGEYLLYNNRLFKVLAAISAGQQLTIGTNIGQTSVAAELTRLNSLLT